MKVIQNRLRNLAQRVRLDPLRIHLDGDVVDVVDVVKALDDAADLLNDLQAEIKRLKAETVWQPVEAANPIRGREHVCLLESGYVYALFLDSAGEWRTDSGQKITTVTHVIPHPMPRTNADGSRRPLR